MENLDFSYFIDVANVWGVDYDSTIDGSNKIRSSTGIAIELISPVGPCLFHLHNQLQNHQIKQRRLGLIWVQLLND